MSKRGVSPGAVGAIGARRRVSRLREASEKERCPDLSADARAAPPQGCPPPRLFDGAFDLARGAAWERAPPAK